MERGAARVRRPLVVIAGIALGQAILYGPSLAGRRVLLPLAILATPQVYLPAPSESTGSVTGDPALSDLIHQFEIERRFAASERSEEHTSELQSRVDISYAVFCLKKKK